VAEIEKQFTRLEAGVAALRRVQANLKRYRAAVLKAACEGRLVPTEAELARAEGRSFESGQQLLARILIERRQNWQVRGKYKEPVGLDATKLFPLPKGWTWTTLDALAEIKGGITKDQNRKHSAPTRSVPYLRVANVQRGYINLTEVKEIVTTEDEIKELSLKPGDILFNEGGDRDKLGRGWVWSGQLPECIHQNHVFRARLHVAELNPKLVSWYANTFGQKFFFDEGKHTTNLASISMSKLKSLPIPIPPASEQTRIVAEVERRLSVVEELESVVTANLQRATRLRQSILQKAFTGML
jgi:type I restriction enzyme S subunit